MIPTIRERAKITYPYTDEDCAMPCKACEVPLRVAHCSHPAYYLIRALTFLVMLRENLLSNKPSAIKKINNAPIVLRDMCIAFERSGTCGYI